MAPFATKGPNFPFAAVSTLVQNILSAIAISVVPMPFGSVQVPVRGPDVMKVRVTVLFLFAKTSGFRPDVLRFTSIGSAATAIRPADVARLTKIEQLNESAFWNTVFARRL